MPQGHLAQTMTTDPTFQSLAALPDTGAIMPALFIGHGSPMNAVEDTEFSRAWAAVANSLPRPRAVLCVSAHWQTSGSRVTSVAQPETIHDFRGFPAVLHAMRYPAPGSPELARLAQSLDHEARIELDSEWGLDHGAWAILCRMYPKADIPVVQLSLDRRKSPELHYQLGRDLMNLRRKGVLVVGSGNIVHNLGQVVWEDVAYDWALEFDAKVKGLIESGDHPALVDHTKLGPSARLSVPTLDHYLPLLYVLGMQQKSEPVRFFADKVTLGSMSMRSVQLG